MFALESVPEKKSRTVCKLGIVSHARATALGVACAGRVWANGLFIHSADCGAGIRECVGTLPGGSAVTILVNIVVVCRDVKLACEDRHNMMGTSLAEVAQSGCGVRSACGTGRRTCP